MVRVVHVGHAAAVWVHGRALFTLDAGAVFSDAPRKKTRGQKHNGRITWSQKFSATDRLSVRDRFDLVSFFSVGGFGKSKRHEVKSITVA